MTTFEKLNFSVCNTKVIENSLGPINNIQTNNTMNMYEWINVQNNFLNSKVDYFNTTLRKMHEFKDSLVSNKNHSNINKYVLNETADSTYANSINISSVKFYYPEPYIASPSMLHSDLWYVHIATYNYWLWYFFSFIIVFFFIMFLVTMRWNNVRLQPKRETRGFSRSKCGDLITGLVPMMWASSIIVHESIDSADWDDGVGTVEMVMAIRAYQWGWEYWYPRSNDLNSELKNHELLLFGKSGINASWCESTVANKYLAEYLNLRNAFATQKITQLFNLNSTNYNIYKLNSFINGKRHHHSKFNNNTRPRHKINLNIDSNVNLYTNNIKPNNYIKYNLTTITNYNKRGVFLTKPLNFYSPLNLFNYQTNYSDAKSYLFFKYKYVTFDERINYQTPLNNLSNIFNKKKYQILNDIYMHDNNYFNNFIFPLTSNNNDSALSINFYNIDWGFNFFKKLFLKKEYVKSKNWNMFFYTKNTPQSNKFIKTIKTGDNTTGKIFTLATSNIVLINTPNINEIFNFTFIKNTNNKNFLNMYFINKVSSPSGALALKYGHRYGTTTSNVCWKLYKQFLSAYTFFTPSLPKWKNKNFFNWLNINDQYENHLLSSVLKQPNKHIFKNYDPVIIDNWSAVYMKHTKYEETNLNIINNVYKQFYKTCGNIKFTSYKKTLLNCYNSFKSINTYNNNNYFVNIYAQNINNYYSPDASNLYLKLKYILNNSASGVLSELKILGVYDKNKLNTLNLNQNYR